MSADYKAHRLGDIVTLLVSETTAAQSTGDVNNSRAFQANSAVTNIPGSSTQAANPLFGMTSSKTLKGQGETSTGSTVTATVSARVIALLPNGSMIVEAERQVVINSQHENLIVRGVLRPGDVGPANTASATALSNLEIELKGKGVVSDYIGRQNPIIRGLLWLLTW
jgi:flagellar L-ring protein FlgH